VRTYTVARASDIEVNPARPKSADFERSPDFDVARYARLAFQYGPAAEQFTAVIVFDASSAWRARQLAGGHGTLVPTEDGGARWSIAARDRARLLRFVLENGPGLLLVEPAEMADALREGLAEVIGRHA